MVAPSMMVGGCVMIDLVTRLARRNMLFLLAGAAVWFSGAPMVLAAADDPRLKQRWRCGGGQRRSGAGRCCGFQSSLTSPTGEGGIEGSRLG